MLIMPHVVRSYWSVAVAIVCGFALLPALQRHYNEWADQRESRHELSRPVVDMSGSLVVRSGDSVIINIRGQKLRDCRYSGITAYSVGAAGVRYDARIERIDLPEKGETKPIGQYDLGSWRIWPIYDETRAVIVFVDHFCGNVQVRSVIAEVQLWS